MNDVALICYSACDQGMVLCTVGVQRQPFREVARSACMIYYSSALSLWGEYSYIVSTCSR